MFGDLVRAYRRRFGLTQEGLAAKTGVHSRTIAKIEVGQINTPRQSTVRLLADAFALAGSDREAFFQAASDGTPPQTSPPRSVLNPLPADVPAFIGRQGQLSNLDASLDRHLPDRTRAAVIAVIGGTAGVGKTALAVHWAHRVADRFPDGQLYVNLRGFDPGGSVMAPAEAIRRFLDALAVSPQRIPADPDAQVNLYRTLLADKKMLVVLDNARDPDQVRPILPGAPGCFVLVTSRNRLAGLVAAEGAHPLPLDLLTVDEARDLVTRRIGPERVTAEPDAVDQIITRCARLPLALTIVAANAATQPHLSLTALADQLGDSHDRLDALSTSDTAATDVRAVLSWSYQALSEDSARLFRLLGLHPCPDISIAAAASLAGAPAGRVRSLLNELASAHLVTEHTAKRYTLHDLLRVYATEQAHRIDPDEQRHAATGRILDHYLHTAHAADRLLRPLRDPVTQPIATPLDGTATEELTDAAEAMAWFATEQPALLAALRHCRQSKLDTRTWQFAWTLTTFLTRRGPWTELVGAWANASRAAERLGDPLMRADAHRHLAQVNTHLHHFGEAVEDFRRALELYWANGNPAGAGHTRYGMALLRERQGRPAAALRHARKAHAHFVAAGHQPGQAMALNGIAWCQVELGRGRPALADGERALTLFQSLGDEHGQADTWDTMGHAHDRCGEPDQAASCYLAAVELYRRCGDRYYEAGSLQRLGDTYATAANMAGATVAWRQALSIFTEQGHPAAAEVAARLEPK